MFNERTCPEEISPLLGVPPLHIDEENRWGGGYFYSVREGKDLKFMETTKRVTKKEQRISIAEDVLRSLAAGKLRPNHLYFYRNFNFVTNTYSNLCDTCALGACLVGMVHLKDEPLPLPGWGTELIKTELTKIFSHKQLVLIECAYEGYTRAGGIAYRDDRDAPSEDQIKRGRKFFERYDDDTRRMRAIMENIIRNGGQFKI